MRHEDLRLGQAQIGETADGGFPFQVLKFSASVGLASVAANVSAEQNVTFTGIEAGDIPVNLNMPVAGATLQTIPIRCGAANTLTVKCTNPTAGAINLAAMDMVLTVIRPR